MHTDTDAVALTPYQEEKLVKPVSSSKVGWSPYTDDLGRQGFIVARNYTHMTPDPHHQHGCPGCQPEKCNPVDLKTWLAIEAKWRAKGDTPSCDIERQEWYTAKYRGRAWWVEARDSIAHYNPALAGRGQAA